MPVVTLSDHVVPTLSCPPESKHTEIFDTLIRGLYVDVFPNGRMSYRVRYRQNGRQRAITLGDARLLTVAEARERARDVLRTVMSGIDPRLETLPEQGPGVADFFLQQYIPYVKSYKRSWAIDESMIRNHFLPGLGMHYMGSMQPPDIARFIEGMRSRGYAAGTCNRALVLLRYGYSLALRWGVEGVAKNPAKELQNIREDNRIERYLTPEQAVRLLQVVRESQNPMLAPIVSLLIYTGARKREVLDARWQDVDWRQKRWRIPRTKSGKVRHVPLSVAALEMLRKLKAEARPGVEPIFPNPENDLPFVSVFYSWNTARRKAGLAELRLHDLRHSFASFLVNAGRSLYEVQELLGHADVRTTTRYAHLSQDRLREAVEVIPICE